MGAGSPGRREAHSAPLQCGCSLARRVSLSSAKVWTYRATNLVGSAELGKATEAKALLRENATLAPIAPCFPKKRMSSASSVSCGSPERMMRSLRAWQSSKRFGRIGHPSCTGALGRFKTKQPKMPAAVMGRGTSITSKASRSLCPLGSVTSSPSLWMQKVTLSPTARRACPQCSRRRMASRWPKTAASSSEMMRPSALPSVTIAPSKAGGCMTVPWNFRRR
mmetsp:Transcript_5739/g.14126  ORF Transcript_5739/g.14126 Transcript_5739/m.14126 type:complete len:222 (+) Transcript_5739:540-1205(+)